MKLKKVGFAVISGVTALSVFALTSCGGKESVDIQAYNNEITESKFYEETEKFRKAVDLTNGYEFTSYNYSKNDHEVNNESSFEKSSTKTIEKYDKTNNLYYKSMARKEEAKTPNANESTDYLKEFQIQMDGERSYQIDLASGLYDDSYIEPSTYSTKQTSLMSFYQNALYMTNMVNESFINTKFYKDDEVFTVEMLTDAAKINEFNNNQAGELKTTISYEGKCVIQFYENNDTCYLAFEASLEGTSTLTKGDKKTELSLNDEAIGYTKIVKNNPTIEKLDLSKYKYFPDFSK